MIPLTPSVVWCVTMSLFRMKKMLDDDESSVEVSVHQQPLVTKSCYHQDRDLNKRQNTAAKLRPKVEARILQLTTEVDQPTRHLSHQNREIISDGGEGTWGHIAECRVHPISYLTI